MEDWLKRTPIDAVRREGGALEPDAEGFVDRYLVAHEKVVAASRDYAQSVAKAASRDVEGERARLTKVYERERAGVVAFLRPGEEEGGAHRGLVRSAILFLETYRELPLLAWPREVLAAVLEVEQAFVMFRQRHARMVERVIGRRTGTGGSAGVEYLDRTALEYRIFGDIWAVRTMLLPAAAAPALRDPVFYGFEAAGGES
ncbi:MAG: tryptophan 2,3-dioxygenase family protein [Planctomycetota bacterium]